MDGHGGATVARFASRHFLEALRSQDSFTKGKFTAALTETYLCLDDMLRDPKHFPELRELVAQDRACRADLEADVRDDRRAERGAKAAAKARKRDQRKKQQQQQSQQQQEKEGASVEVGLIEQDQKGGAVLPLWSPVAARAGSTSLTCLVVDDLLHLANVGDSRAVLSSSGGKAVRLTEDHKPWDLNEATRVARAGGSVRNGRINGNLNVSRSLGDLRYKQDGQLLATQQMVSANPDVVTHKLRQGDEFLVLACDGVWDCLSDQECVNHLRSHMLLQSPPPSSSLSSSSSFSEAKKEEGGIGGEEKGNRRRPVAAAVDAGSAIASLLARCVALEHPLASGSAVGSDNMTCVVVVFASPEVDDDEEKEEAEEEKKRTAGCAEDEDTTVI
jgi:serine/threonine protein phosphatase PrpC